MYRCAGSAPLCGMTAGRPWSCRTAARYLCMRCLPCLVPCPCRGSAQQVTILEHQQQLSLLCSCDNIFRREKGSGWRAQAHLHSLPVEELQGQRQQEAAGGSRSHALSEG